MPMNSPRPRSTFWPYGIVVAFGLFLAGLITLITFAAREPAELVAADYYEQEIRYQDQLDRLHRARALAVQLKLEARPERHSLQITFPPDQARRGIQGTVRLYRPSEAGQDRSLPLALGPEGVQVVNLAGLIPGPWQVKVDWRCEELDYSVAETLTLPKPAL